jgi:hypothetical protein
MRDLLLALAVAHKLSSNPSHKAQCMSSVTSKDVFEGLSIDLQLYSTSFEHTRTNTAVVRLGCRVRLDRL